MIFVYIFWSGGSKYMSDHNDRMVYTDVHQAASAGCQAAANTLVIIHHHYLHTNTDSQPSLYLI